MTTETPNNKQEKFMALYNPLHERLNRFVQSMVWNRDDAKDIISETVLIAFTGLEKLRDEKAFLSYLFSIASRLARRKEWRKKFWGVFDSSAAENLASHDRIELRTEINELYEALNKLPIKQREAITLFEISGFSIKEIAEIQQSTESGVKSRMLRAREKLSILLEVERKPNNIQVKVSMKEQTT